MKVWDKDAKLERWKKSDMQLDIAEDYLVFELEVLKYRKSLGSDMDSPNVYWNSIEQLEERVEWLKHRIKVMNTRLYKLLN